MNPARAHLRLGLTAVGTFVVLASSALATDASSVLARVGGAGAASEAGSSSQLEADVGVLALVALLYLLVSLPFDVLGGSVLPRRAGRPAPDLPAFFGAWLRAGMLQVVVMIAAATAILQAGRAGGLVGGVAAYALVMAVLLAGQELLARFVAGLRPVAADDVSSSSGSLGGAAFPGTAGALGLEAEGARANGVPVVAYEGSDPGFTGGITGLPGAERLVVPAHWKDRLGSWPLVWMLERRRALVASGARTRGIALAAVWNLLGFTLVAVAVPGAGVESVQGLLDLGFGLVLWQVVGMAVLAGPGRAAVVAGDRLLLDSGACEPQALAATLRRLEVLREDREVGDVPPSWFERALGALPSVGERTAAWSSSAERDAAAVRGWHAARTSLFLGWGCLGFLSRAVPCNLGRPERWVLLPCD